MNDAVNNFNRGIENEEIKLRFLFKQLENATKGTKEYETAKKKILNTYDQYLTDIDRENLALGNQVKVYSNLKVAIREAMAEKALQEGGTEIGKVLTDSTQKTFDLFEKGIKELSKNRNLIPEELWNQIGSYIRGEIDTTDFTVGAKKLYNEMKVAVDKVAEQNKDNIIGNYWMLGWDPDELRKQYADAGRIADEAMSTLSKRLELLYGPNRPGDSGLLNGWRADIDKIKQEAEKEGVILNLKIDENSTLATVVSDVSSAIEDAKKSMQLAEGIEDGTAQIEKKRLAYLEKINEVLLGKATPGGPGGSSADPRIKQIQAEIKAYQDLKDAYESLVEYMDDNAARTALNGFFGGLYGSKTDADFDAEIERLTFELAQLGEEGAEAAQTLLNSFAMDAFRKYQEEAKKSASMLVYNHLQTAEMRRPAHLEI